MSLQVDERDRRWKNIRDAMRREGLDCLIVYGSRAMDQSMASLRYLTNVSFAEGYLVFPLEGEPTLFPFIARKRGQWANQWVSDFRNGHPLYPRAIAEKIEELRLQEGAIGFVSADEYWKGFGMPHSTHAELSSLLKKAKFSDASRLVESARLVKSEPEIACLERASRVGVEVIDTIRNCAKPGADHRMVKRRCIDVMYDNGCEIGHMFLYSFGDNITHGGVNTGFVDTPGPKIVKQDEVILTEFAVRHLGYEAQYNQPFVAGRPSKEWQRAFDACFEAYEAGFGALKPGLTSGELDDMMQSPILRAGFTFENPMFHGLGLAIEQPMAAMPLHPLYVPDRSFVFKKDMVLELEPHAMTANKSLGLSLGDTVVVTDSGCRRLGKESKPEFVATA